MHYLSEARRLSETLNNCSICSEQLAKVGADASQQLLELTPVRQSLGPISNRPTQGQEPECNCQLGELDRQLEQRQRQQQQQPFRNLSHCLQTPSSSTLKSSYHTASSSLPLAPTKSHQDFQQQEPKSQMLNTSDDQSLKVLPLASQPSSSYLPTSSSVAVAQAHVAAEQQRRRQQQQRQQSIQLMSCNQMDSSLSSLFVYRHVSDNENAPFESQQFDPDSLEVSHSQQALQPISNNNKRLQATLNSSKLQQQQKSTTRQSQQQKQSGGGWLKPRPKSDYIPLSSATSSLSTSQTVALANAQSNKRKETTSSKFQVDSDLSQSSIVKRRQLLNGGTPGTANATKAKKLLLESKSNSRSSPNISAGQQQNSSTQPGNSQASKKHQCSRSSGSLQANTTTTSSSSSSQVKSIYQCVKNHLLDMTNSSKSSSHSVSQSNSSSGKRNSSLLHKQQSATLPKSCSLTSSLTSSSSGKKTAKSVQVGARAWLLSGPLQFFAPLYLVPSSSSYAQLKLRLVISLDFFMLPHPQTNSTPPPPKSQ